MRATLALGLMLVSSAAVAQTNPQSGGITIFGTTSSTYVCDGIMSYSPCPTEWDKVIKQLEQRRDALTTTIDLLKREKGR